MSEKIFNQIVQKITKLILTNEQKMIREEDLLNLCPESIDFEQVINQTYKNLMDVGFELITSTFLEQKFYILTTEGKDDDITPSQYGTLAFILALTKEVDENLKFSDLRDIFSKIWDSVEFLLKKDYIRKLTINNLEIIKVTPLGKALLKNVIENINLKNVLEIIKKE